MRVLHILDHSIPLQSGYSFRTLAILREQRKRGWETFHLTSQKQQATAAAEEEVDSWHFFRTPVSARPSTLPGLSQWDMMRALERRLVEVVEKVKPDILHAHSPVLNAFPTLRVGKRLRLPVVYEIRAFWEDAAVDHGTASEGGVRYRLTRALETLAARRADHVTTICEGLRGDLIGRGLPPGKITVIPNAVDTDAFEVGRESDAALRHRFGLAGATVLGFIGSYYAYEGLALVIDALPSILKSHPDVKLLFVGGGPEEQALRGQATAAGLADKVVFTGRVPNADVGKYYDLIDVLVYARLPMRLTELVTPLKPLEAMAQGRSFIASDVGGHRELIIDRQNGFLFNAGDVSALAGAVEAVLADPQRRHRILEEARRFVEQERTWAASVARYEDVYQQASLQLSTAETRRTSVL